MAACERCAQFTIMPGRPVSHSINNLADAVDWNEEEHRNTGMRLADLKGWFMGLAALEKPGASGVPLLHSSVRISADRAAEA
jgi:hypothetical protein